MYVTTTLWFLDISHCPAQDTPGSISSTKDFPLVFQSRFLYHFAILMQMLNGETAVFFCTCHDICANIYNDFTGCSHAEYNEMLFYLGEYCERKSMSETSLRPGYVWFIDKWMNDSHRFVNFFPGVVPLRMANMSYFSQSFRRIVIQLCVYGLRHNRFKFASEQH